MFSTHRCVEEYIVVTERGGGGLGVVVVLGMEVVSVWECGVGVGVMILG